MGKYGFVYIWRDSKHKRFYIGSHWGTENDGYVCSSTWMKNAHKRRPEDFKRRIVARVATKDKLLISEQIWLDLIRPEELGKKYYNLRKDCLNLHWQHDPLKMQAVTEKISNKLSGRKNPSAARPRTELEKQNLSTKLKGRKLGYERTKRTREMIANNSKRLQQEKKIGMWNKKHTPETKQKMSRNNAMNNPVYVQKVKESKRGIKWLQNSEGHKKMAVPNTEKWNQLLSMGFVPLINLQEIGG